MLPPPPTPTLFPYTTLFRSQQVQRAGEVLLEGLVIALLDAVGRQDRVGGRTGAGADVTDGDPRPFQVLDRLDAAALEGDQVRRLGVESGDPAQVVHLRPFEVVGAVDRVISGNALDDADLRHLM